MPLKKIVSTIMVGMILLISGAFEAKAAVTFEWIGGPGDWSNDSNWDQTIPPNDGGHIARIVSVSAGVTVNLDISVTVGELEVGGSDTLAFNDQFNLSLELLDGATDPVFTNNGLIRIDASANPTHLIANNAEVRLTGTGILRLMNSANARLAAAGAGSFINDTDHTIEGSGQLLAPITNDGLILANAGDLSISGSVTNTNGILRASSPGTLALFGWIEGGIIDPSNGVVELKSALLYNVNIETGSVEVLSAPELKGNCQNQGVILISDGTDLNPHELSFNDDDGQPVLNNPGTIRLASPNGNTQSLSSPSSTYRTLLDGSGNVLLEGTAAGICRLSGTLGFINGAGHTIQGAGRIEAPVENRGVIEADGGILEVRAPITGTGNIFVNNGTFHIVTADVETNDFSMATDAFLTVEPNRVLDLDGNFTFAQTIESKWSWGTGATLAMSPGCEKTLEVGGEDRGLTAGGFGNNFALENLYIQSSATRVVLTDAVDNGNRDSDEALYVRSLQVQPGATLDLNGLRLYTWQSGAPYLVKAGDGYLFSGGVIEDSSLAIYTMNISIPSGGGSVQDDVGVTCPGVCAPQYTENSTVAFTAIPNAGYSFVRWDGDLGGSTVNPVNITWISDMDVEAVFTPLPTVTWLLKVNAPDFREGSVTGPGIQCPLACVARFKDGESISLTAVPAAGYDFIEWSGDLAGVTDNPATITMNSNTEVSAVFAPTRPPVTLTTAVSPAGGGAVAGVGINCPGDCEEIHDQGAVATLTAAPVPGYTFVRWDGDLAGVADNPVHVTMDSDKNVTAVFAPESPKVTLTVTISPAGGGSAVGTGIDCPGDCDESFNQNAAATLTAAPAPGYAFVRWDGDLAGVSDNPVHITMNSDKNVTAVFAQVGVSRLLTVAVSPADGGVVTGEGIDCSADCQEIFDDRTTVTLSAAPAAGFQFSHWTGDLDGSANPAALDMDADKSVTAVFVEVRYTLEVEISPGGGGSVNGAPIACPDVCDATYDPGASATLRAAPAPGFRFDHWEGDLQGASNTGSLIMDGNKKVIAVFIPGTHALSLSVFPERGGLISTSRGKCPVNCEQIYAQGALATLEAIPAPGYLFDHWEQD
ncbi:MAG: hypothetical protein GY859_14250, partial [Desulfobacterales bacterium]|nr:hypothetical protein [Desulfobacterales bacterium]